MQKVDGMVLAIVNAPYKTEIDGVTLARCISTADFGDWTTHVANFFSDVPPELIYKFTERHGISPAALSAAYHAAKAKTGEINIALELAGAELLTHHERLWAACRQLEWDYEPYGRKERDGPDCSGGCKHFEKLEGEAGLDWGVCVNRCSHRCGLLTFEHQGCGYFEA